jgi:hypothetical protein
MTLTFVDSGELIAAGRGTHAASAAAIAVLADPTRQFVTSDFARLERTTDLVGGNACYRSALF